MLQIIAVPSRDAVASLPGLGLKLIPTMEPVWLVNGPD
jgi:hypothetical protein